MAVSPLRYNAATNFKTTVNGVLESKKNWILVSCPDLKNKIIEGVLCYSFLLYSFSVHNNAIGQFQHNVSCFNFMKLKTKLKSICYYFFLSLSFLRSLVIQC